MQTFTGTLLRIRDAEPVGQKGTLKGSIVLEEISDSEYPNSLSIDLRGEKTEWLTTYNIGDILAVEINTRVNENKEGTRDFNSISAWKVKVESKGTTEDNIDEILPF